MAIGEYEERRLGQAMMRGFSRRCPACGRGALFAGYLRVAHDCPACGTALHHQRADDAPPYFTIFIVGHLVIPGTLAMVRYTDWSTLAILALWLPVTLALSFWMLPRIKGALVGLQWQQRMHGFAAAALRHGSWTG